MTALHWPHYTTPAMRRHAEHAWKAMAYGATQFPPAPECAPAERGSLAGDNHGVTHHALISTAPGTDAAPAQANVPALYWKGVGGDCSAAHPAATCECGATIHEDRGARDHIGNPQCLTCEMDTLAREQRYD